MTTHPVYLWNVPGYDVERIRDVVGRSMDGMGLRVGRRVLVKPNTVIAHPDLFTHANTRAEFLDGVLGAIRSRVSGETMEIAVGERCGITIPTRFAFHNSGFPPVIEKHDVRARYFEEERQVEVKLEKRGRLRRSLYVPESVVRSDFLVNLPKFKSHPWTAVTFALKNYIGIQTDEHRLIDHDYALNEKIADLQEVVAPSLIAIDAITAGTGRMLTPEPVELGLVVCGVNPVAVDATCCRIIGLDPADVDHVRFCAERGHGPMDEASIELRGDVTLEEARSRAGAFVNSMIPVDRFFEATPVTAIYGPPPDSKHHDYCWGGCPGAVEEAIDILKAFYPTSQTDMRPMHIVYGDCRGRDITTRPGERVFFYGDCCRFDGRINGEKVVIDSTYIEREKKDPRRARAEDLVQKIIKSYSNAFLSWHRPWVRITGCPVSVAEHVLMMSIFGSVPNPYIDRRVTPRFCIAYVQAHAGLVLNWLSSR